MEVPDQVRDDAGYALPGKTTGKDGERKTVNERRRRKRGGAGLRYPSFTPNASISAPRISSSFRALSIFRPNTSFT